MNPIQFVCNNAVGAGQVLCQFFDEVAKLLDYNPFAILAYWALALAFWPMVLWVGFRLLKGGRSGQDGREETVIIIRGGGEPDEFFII